MVISVPALVVLLLANLPPNRALELNEGHVTAPVIVLEPTSDWTVECDFVLDELFGALIDNQPSSAGDGILLEVAPGPRLSVTVNGSLTGNTTDTLFEVPVEYGRHYHIALTYQYDSGTGLGDMYWYVNGVQYEALLQVDYAANTFNDLCIGRLDSGPVKLFHGRIDNIHMTQELLYNGDFEPSSTPPAATPNSQLLATFDLAEPGDTTYADESGLGNTLVAHDTMIVPVDTIGLEGGYARLNGFSSILVLEGVDLSSGTDITLEFDMRAVKRPGALAPMTLANAIDPDIASAGGFAVSLDPQTQFLTITTKAAMQPPDATVVGFPITDAEWHRLAIVLEQITTTTADLRVYVDGQRQFQGSVGYQQPPVRDITLGARLDAALQWTDHYSGHLDQIRLSHVARYSGASYPHYPGNIEDDGDTNGFWLMSASEVSPASFSDGSGVNELLASDVEAAHTWANPFWATPDLSPTPAVYATPQLPWGDEWTIEFWTERLTSLSAVILDAYDDAGMTGMELSVDATHQLTVRVDGVTYTLGALVPSEWNHVVVQQRIAAVGPPSVVRLRAIINGTSQTQTAPFTGPHVSTSHLLLGNNDSNTMPWPSSLHSLRISSALRYSGDIPTTRSTLGSDSQTLGVWSIDESLGEPLIDRGPNARHFDLCDGSVTFTSQPTDQTSCVGETVQLTVASLDSLAVFQWRKDGLELPGETQNTLVLEDIAMADEGDYDCLVSIGCDTVLSDVAVLTVNDSYEFSTWPTDQSICVDDTLMLDVTVDVAPKRGGGFELQWQKDGVNLLGETSATLTIVNAQTSDSGVYSCRLRPLPNCSFQYSPAADIQVLGPTANAGPIRVICLPGGSATLSGSIACPSSGTINWFGPGSIVDGTSLAPTVTPPASSGDYFYTLQYDYVGGSSIDQVLVQVRDYGFAFVNGMVDLNDILDSANQWHTVFAPPYDVYPATPDGVIDVRDMIALTQCHSYSP